MMRAGENRELLSPTRHLRPFEISSRDPAMKTNACRSRHSPAIVAILYENYAASRHCSGIGVRRSSSRRRGARLADVDCGRHRSWNDVANCARLTTRTITCPLPRGATYRATPRHYPTQPSMLKIVIVFAVDRRRSRVHHYITLHPHTAIAHETYWIPVATGDINELASRECGRPGNGRRSKWPMRLSSNQGDQENGARARARTHASKQTGVKVAVAPIIIWNAVLDFRRRFFSTPERSSQPEAIATGWRHKLGTFSQTSKITILWRHYLGQFFISGSYMVAGKKVFPHSSTGFASFSRRPIGHPVCHAKV